MSRRVGQMSAGGAPGLPQGFVRIRIKGENLSADSVQLVIGRTGAQGGPEYLRAYNEIGGASLDASEALQYRWGADEGRVSPYAVTLDGNELSFDLGRNVNAHLDQQTNYRLLLCIDGMPVQRECTLAWARVAPVRPGDLATFVARPQVPDLPAAPAPGRPPVVPSAAGAPAASVVIAPMDDPGATNGAVARSRWPIAVAAALLLLVAAAGGAYWWFLGRGQPENTVAESAKPAPAATKPDPAAGSSDPAASASQPAVAAPSSSASASAVSTPTETREQRLARIVAQGAEAALAAGRQAQAAKELDEAEFLYRNACDRGKVEGCRFAAQLYDPVELAPGRETQRSPADARQAVSLYRKAVEAGSAEAEKDLERLRDVIEKAAQAGDSTARVLLDTWPRKP